jgi:hypothetical protein
MAQQSFDIDAGDLEHRLQSETDPLNALEEFLKRQPVIPKPEKS